MNKIERHLSSFSTIEAPENLRRRLQRAEKPWELDHVFTTLHWAVTATLLTLAISWISEYQQRGKLAELCSQAQALANSGRLPESIREQVSDVLDDSSEAELTDYFVALARHYRHPLPVAKGGLWDDRLDGDWYLALDHEYYANRQNSVYGLLKGGSIESRD